MEHHSFPQFPESYWIESTNNLPSYPTLNQDIEADITIVGGGISGITTAYLLVKEGYKVVLLDAGKLLNGTTGHTTAKITAQHDLIYDEFVTNLGQEKASLYYQASNDALQFIKQTVTHNQIQCGFSEQDAYVYTDSIDYLKKLEDEMAAYKLLGIPSSYSDHIPLQVPAKAAIIMHNQAQFHPLHYLTALVREYIEAGGEIYENTTAIDVEKGSLPKVITSDGHHITCKYVASCTHFPFYDGLGFYFARMHADRSYVLGVKVADDYPGGMYISAEDPKRSIRHAETADQQKLILIGGQSHKTGQGICTISHYEELQQFTERHFNLQEIAYRWSTQDLVTGDKIPYIGRITASSPNIFVATGYRKWGMTNSTAAALLIRDLIMEKENPYEKLFEPSRSTSFTTIKKLIVDNADVAKHLIAGKLERINKRPEDLALDEGSVVQIKGRRAGGYKDKNGELYLVDTTCTHMGCEVEWNNGDRTWDCPCHGSRFSISGDVIEGPAEKPLSRLEAN
ncbi:FAD-dependent oxidoreductase [Paenibacillus baekrokdamisoli]|uniref:FAD-dependent oxidoreductase n=1 Tax=Paenibacillus baekrokdamisoli TaxID=1712516 RepID=UPI000F7861AF|nr:FAD-dependent oxidoreductase [Paenibacillus baekrokdamisoli]